MSQISRLARLNPDVASPQSASTSAILGKLEALDNVLRLSLDKPKDEQQPAAAPALSAAAPAPSAAAPARAQPNFATAFDLLNRASVAMDVLQNRCDELENAAKVRADHFKMALDVAHQQLKACEDRAAGLEAKFNESAAVVVAANQRAEAANQRAESSEKRAQAAEQSARDSAEWVKCCYERIVSAFGTRGDAMKTTA